MHLGAMRNNKPGLTLLKVWMGKRSSASSANQACARIWHCSSSTCCRDPEQHLEQSTCHEGHFLKPPLRDHICLAIREVRALSSSCVGIVNHHLISCSAPGSIQHHEESEEQSGSWAKEGTWLGASL